jgi:DNA-binding MarR family transcriptional regulator
MAEQREAVATSLHAAAIHLLRRLRRVDERTGVSAAKLSALSVLVFGGATRLTDLARAEQVRPPTITRLVAGLEAEGLVRRAADPSDARAVRIEATARGRRLLHEGRRRRVEALADALADLPPEHVAALGDAASLIERIARAL